MMDVKGPDDVGLVGDTGSSDVGIVNRREVNDGFHIDHGFYDLAKVLNVSNKVFDRASFLTGQAVEHSDLMRSAVEQIAHDPLTDFTNDAGDENFHCTFGLGSWIESDAAVKLCDPYWARREPGAANAQNRNVSSHFCYSALLHRSMHRGGAKLTVF